MSIPLVISTLKGEHPQSGRADCGHIKWQVHRSFSAFIATEVQAGEASISCSIRCCRSARRARENFSLLSRAARTDILGKGDRLRLRRSNVLANTSDTVHRLLYMLINWKQVVVQFPLWPQDATSDIVWIQIVEMQMDVGFSANSMLPKQQNTRTSSPVHEIKGFSHFKTSQISAQTSLKLVEARRGLRL